ncbi:MAG TPA: OmpA family protein [Puia sp.]|nr:OmpA family protein [Puia sp.]
MKKCLLLFPLMLFFYLGMQAQVRLGLLGGIHSATIQEKNNIPGWDTATKKYQSSRSGIQIGAIVEMPIGHKGFFFQPAILYTARGRQYNRYYDTVARKIDTIYSKQNLGLNYIDIPLNLTYKVFLASNHKSNFFVSAGPYISFFYNGKASSESLTKPPDTAFSRKLIYKNESVGVNVGRGTDTYKTTDIGFNARAGFEFGNLILSGYLSQGLTSFYNAPYTGTFHHQLMGLSLGIWLSSTTPPARPPKPPKAPPADSDNDGISDEQDLCPLLPGTLAWHGCPVPDSDNDGINDEHDSCRTTPGLARYNGCPIPDRDGDGVNDEEDKCPDKVGVARYQGCPIPDTDGDGVNDEQDKCPTEPGSVENQGCPEIKKEITEKINYTASNILFESGIDRLTGSSGAPLDELAALLQAHPELDLTIEGHTDNEGNPGKNKLLSQKRAASVKAYLIRKGITGVRLTATGFGQDQPRAGNTSPEGRAANRRVELKVKVHKQ